MKDIQPYKKFWGNCIINMFLSILTKVDPSYDPLAYLNYYEYSYYPDNVFHLDYTQEYYNSFRSIFDYEIFKFKDKKDFLAEFKNVLMTNPFATINVDLYYWNSAAYYYNKIHSSHLAFVTGFDEEKDIFYGFEDDVNLFYDVREIPTSRVIQAFNSSHKQVDGDYRILSFKQDTLPQYEINIKQFLKCTNELIYNLDMLIDKKEVINKVMISEDISKIHHYNYEFSKISNRLKGNILLINTFEDMGLLKKDIAHQLIAIFDDSCVKWKNIQSVYLRHCLRNNFSEIDNIEEKISTLFMKEKEVWESVAEHLNKKPI